MQKMENITDPGWSRRTLETHFVWRLRTMRPLVETLVSCWRRAAGVCNQVSEGRCVES